MAYLFIEFLKNFKKNKKLFYALTVNLKQILIN